jgi:hypothetical protein
VRLLPACSPRSREMRPRLPLHAANHQVRVTAFAKIAKLLGTHSLRSQLNCSSLEQIDQNALDATSPHADALIC